MVDWNDRYFWRDDQKRKIIISYLFLHGCSNYSFEKRVLFTTANTAGSDPCDSSNSSHFSKALISPVLLLSGAIRYLK